MALPCEQRSFQSTELSRKIEETSARRVKLTYKGADRFSEHRSPRTVLLEILR